MIIYLYTRNNSISIQDASIRLDSIDLAIIRVMVIQGCTSAYAIWLQLKQESKDSGHEKEIIAYKNVNVRLTKLVKIEYITEVAPHAYTQHGRRDYKVTNNGLEYLLPYILMHPEEIQNMVKYMDKFGIDKKGFGQVLLRTLLIIAKTIKEYQRSTNIPYDRHELAKLLNQSYDIIVKSGSEITNDMLNRDVKEILEILDKDKKKKKST